MGLKELVESCSATLSIYSASVARVWRFRNLIITIIITTGRLSTVSIYGIGGFDALLSAILLPCVKLIGDVRSRK